MPGRSFLHRLWLPGASKESPGSPTRTSAPIDWDHATASHHLQHGEHGDACQAEIWPLHRMPAAVAPFPWPGAALISSRPRSYSAELTSLSGMGTMDGIFTPINFTFLLPKWERHF